MTEFTPWSALLGGGLIGLAAVLLMLVQGRIMGATGIVGGLIAPASRADFAWRAALVLGMIGGPGVLWALRGQMPVTQVPVSGLALVLGGFIVGLGATWGAGCTSGHGVCGLARLSPRSLAATLAFMASAGATVYVTRHVMGG